ncbi:MAG TPA: pilin [Candidatus Competibacteraceae bacterium]|nr:pilin [Candidatus Competibacteraceae bacterium]
MSRTRSSLALGLSLALTASAAPGELPPPVEAPRLTAVFSSAPYLRAHLPAEAVAYARIPNPWSWLAGPSGKRTDTMLTQPAYVATVERLRQALAADSLLGREAHPAAALAHALDGPLELAVLSPNRVANPLSSVLLTVRLRLDGRAALEQRLRALAEVMPELELGKPFDGAGYAELSWEGKPLFAHYDEASRQFTLLGGLAPSAAELHNAVQALARPTPADHPMPSLEQALDQSGQGLVLWFNMDAWRPMLSLGLSGEEAAAVRKLLEQLRGAVLGWGTREGLGRLGLVLDVRGDQWLRYLPRASHDITLQSAGAPGFVVSLALPTRAELVQLEQAIGEDFGPEALQDYRELDAQVKDSTGLGLAEWVSAFGPELVVFSDRAGLFAAVRLADAATWQRALELARDRLQARYERREQGGVVYHHLSLPSLDSTLAPQGDVLAQAWTQRVRDHLYWLEEDGYLIFADVPQALRDRVRHSERVAIAEWLARSQGQDSRQALLLASARQADIPRWTYHAYLQGLDVLGDLADAPVDLFALPSAGELALPAEGALGLQLEAGAERLALLLSYEQTPLEVLAGGGSALTLAAVAGILAAVAIPAYQDYMVRSQVVQTLGEVAPLKERIAEFHAAQGRFPNAEEVATLLPPEDSHRAGYSVELEPDTGAIGLSWPADGPGGGGELWLTPVADENGGLSWGCGSTLEDKYLPAECWQGQE